MSEHTPIPWERGTFGDCGDGFTGHQIWNRMGGEVCILRIAVNQREDAGLDDFKARVEANAEFIVRACNSHDSLLTALGAAEWGTEGLCGACEHSERHQHETNCLVAVAIAKAKGG